MAIRDLFKISRKTFLNPSGWLDFDNLRIRTSNVVSILKAMFTLPVPDRSESFAAAMKRQGLNESNIKSMVKTYQSYAILFFVLGLCLFFYSFYLLFSSNTFAGFLIGIAASAVLFSQAFRFDFWVMQMREQKLGMTFDDWKNHILGNKRKSS